MAFPDTSPVTTEDRNSDNNQFPRLFLACNVLRLEAAISKCQTRNRRERIGDVKVQSGEDLFLLENLRLRFTYLNSTSGVADSEENLRSIK